MYRCIFCGLESQSENARFCSKCGPDSPANNWKSEEIDNATQVEQYVSILGDLYFDNHSVTEVENLSLRRREKLKISYDTHISILAEFTKQKKSIAHLSKFRFEFNENVTDAYAGHDTFLEFQISNLSDDESLKFSLFWDDPETVDRIELRAESKKFIKPNSTVSINCTSVFDRIGIKEISDLQVTVTDEYGEKASFRVEPFRFKVGNPDQRTTNNFSTHNQISIEGRGVIDASRMGANQSGLSGDLADQKLWKELFFHYNLKKLPAKIYITKKNKYYFLISDDYFINILKSLKINNRQLKNSNAWHVLIVGGDSEKKSFINDLILRDLCLNVRKTSGDILESPKDLAAILLNLGSESLLEFHNIDKLEGYMWEIYTTAMNGQIKIEIGEEDNIRSLDLNVARYSSLVFCDDLDNMPSNCRELFDCIIFLNQNELWVP